MSQRVDHLAQNVKGETENMKHKFSSLEQNLKDLSSGGLFGQIDSMIQELKRLNDLNDKYELRHFLTCAELERRALIVEENYRRIQYLEENLQKCEFSLKESERLREEDKAVLRRNLEYEVENMRNAASGEKQRLERRIQELQADLARKDHMIDELNRNLAALQDTVSKTKLESQSSISRQVDIQRQLENQIKTLQADHTISIRQIEVQFQAEMENMKKRAEEDKLLEIEKQKRLVSEYYSQQLSSRESEMSRLSHTIEGMRNRLAELERENAGLHNQLDLRSKEASEFKDQLITMRRTHEEYTIKITETNRLAIQKAIGEKEKELRDKLELELSKIEKELKEKKALILNLEQKIIFMEKENQRNASRLSDMTVERDELKSKLIDAEKRFNEEMRIVEETLTIQIQEQHGELNRLLIQNKELSEGSAFQLEQERNRANAAAGEADHLRREIVNLKELSEKRNREIEEWRTKYRGYITGEEAASMRDELTRLRRINMEYEDEIARSRSEIGKFNERMRSYAVEMEAKDHELMNLTELSNRRKQEVLMTQQDNDKIMNMLRNMTDQKDTIDAQKLMTEEKYMKMDREIQQLRQERDRFRTDFEKTQILLQQANKKIAESSIQLEEMAQAVGNSQRVSTTTTTMRTSNMYGSKAYDPNYRGEAFGK